MKHTKEDLIKIAKQRYSIGDKVKPVYSGKGFYTLADDSFRNYHNGDGETVIVRVVEKTDTSDNTIALYNCTGKYWSDIIIKNNKTYECY